MAQFCIHNRKWLEATFLRLCRDRGPDWTEAVLRPLKLTGEVISVKDIPTSALRAVAMSFNTTWQPTPGICLR